MKIGSHVSISGGLLGAAREAHSYGANVFMIYTGAPQNTRRQPVEKLKVQEGLKYMKENGITEFVVHAPYIINMASPKEDVYNLAKSFLKVEIERTEKMGARYLILHPGSYTEKDTEYGITRICSGLNEVLSMDTNVTVLLETMSGKGSEVGKTFEELKCIVDNIQYKEKIGICFDTCHTHDSGYSISSDFDGVLKEFKKFLEIDLIRVFHINGSLNKQGSKKDRHANIGAGPENPKGKDYIGFEPVYNLIRHPEIKDCIFILETPWIDKNTNLYKEEIMALKGPAFLNLNKKIQNIY